jgi:hypothetical protein
MKSDMSLEASGGSCCVTHARIQNKRIHWEFLSMCMLVCYTKIAYVELY